MSNIPKPFNVLYLGSICTLIFRDPVEDTYAVIDVHDTSMPGDRHTRLEEKKDRCNELFAKWWQSAMRHAKYLSQTKEDD